MPSPIAHSAVAYVLYSLSRPGTGREERLRSEMPMVGDCLLLANLPDLDFVPQIITGERYHHGFTHSILFAVFSTVVFVGIFSRILGKARYPLLKLSLALSFSHLAMDAMTAGGSGIPLLWPFADDLYRNPFAIFPETHHSKGINLRGHLIFVLFELCFAAFLYWVLLALHLRQAATEKTVP